MASSPKTQILTQNMDANKSTIYVYVITVLSAVGGFLFGYDTGVVSGAMILLRDYFQLNYTWQELIVSITVVAAWLFALVGGFAADKMGRKPVILVASSVFTIGAVLMGSSWGKLALLLGRLVVGIGIGLASMAVPMYIAEVSPAHIRGRLVSLNNTCITFGQMIASIVDGVFSKDAEKGWRYMLGLAAIPALIQFVGVIFMPESPRWLVGKKKYDKAIAVLQKIRGPNADVRAEFESIKETCLEEERVQDMNKGESWLQSLIIVQVLKRPTLRRALAVGCGLQIIQQLCGVNTVMYYSATIIQMSGVRDNSKVIWLSCATATANSTCSILSLLFVEKVGRRILTLVSLAGVIGSLCFLAVGFQLGSAHSPAISQNLTSDSCSRFRTCDDCVSATQCGYCFFDTVDGPANGSCLAANSMHPEMSSYYPCNTTDLGDELTWAHLWCPSDYSWMTLCGLIIYLMCFAPGMGPMPWTINSEIYPLWARSTCYSASTSFNWLCNFIVSVSFLTLTQELTKHGTFWLYTVISFIGFVFIFLTLPETKGRRLEEVEDLFLRPWWKQMFKGGQSQYVTIDGVNSPHETVKSREINS